MKPKSPTLYSSDNMNISKSFHSKEGDIKEVKESKKIKVIPKTKKTKKWFFTANIEYKIVAIDLSFCYETRETNIHWNIKAGIDS